MRLVSRLLLIVALAIATLGVMTAPSQADEGTWVLQCGFVKSLPDDPIVHPGMPGMAHLHDFLGNVTVDAFSTYESMRAGATSCPAGDRAGYWLPAVLRNDLLGLLRQLGRRQAAGSANLRVRHHQPARRVPQLLGRGPHPP